MEVQSTDIIAEHLILTFSPDNDKRVRTGGTKRTSFQGFFLV